MKIVKLKYDGRWTWFPTEENRQWTVISSFIDEAGKNRKGGSFGLAELKLIGVIPVKHQVAA